MTVTVLATPTTQTKRREPLRVIDMASSQARARHAAAPGGTGKGGGRRTRSSMDKRETIDEAVNGDKKRKAGVYDEDIEGFQFSRITNKKQKASKSTEQPALPAIEESAPQPSPRRGRPPKKRVEEKASEVAEPKKASEETGKRRTRGRVKQAPAPGPEPEPEPTPEVEPQPQPRTEGSKRSPRKRDEGEQVQTQQVPIEKKRKKGRPSKSHEEQRNGFVSPEQPPAATATTIALPVADTPVIQRNREMRGKKSGKGGRRSSLSMRGRRASSLIDSGASNALPHDKVDTAEFYKHIAADGLVEPRRMRQLLIWCGTRALLDKPSGSRSGDESARLAARVIQEELVKDFASNSELSNWFSREDTAPTVVVKKANPKNVQNQDKIKELEEQIQKLQKERHALNALLRPPSIPRTKTSKQMPNGQSDSHPPEPTQPASSEDIDPSVLDPSQQQILASLNPSLNTTTAKQDTQPPSQPDSQTEPQPQPQPVESKPEPILPPIPPSSISTRLSKITSRLAPTIDSFAAGLHDIELYRSMSDAVSSKALQICAERLEERDARNALRRLAITVPGEADAGSEGSGTGEGEEGIPFRTKSRTRPREDLGPILGALSRVERR
ncbi:Mis12-Mtw1 protein family-domain-containing protein [Aspergillus multicolor]|uniref:Mis12-Mtw1 family protein n=1 Tax=Aspergillus multicolor TaxID=41759 RepID=UPI003CCCBFC4